MVNSIVQVRASRRRLNQDPRTEGARARIDLRLGQIEKVFALNVARAHVIADGETDRVLHVSLEQSQFWFGHAPLRVLANPYGGVWPNRFLARDLKNSSGRSAS
jgi:hypothetical protein